MSRDPLEPAEEPWEDVTDPLDGPALEYDEEDIRMLVALLDLSR